MTLKRRVSNRWERKSHNVRYVDERLDKMERAVDITGTKSKQETTAANYKK